MVPIKPGDDVDGEPIQYSNPKLDPLWEAIAESGIPLCFHIGEAIPTAAPGAAGTFVLTQMQGFRHIWGQLTFGGVFDRFPKLRVVFVEGGICWVASMLHDADMIYNSFPTAMNPKLAHPPSWYWFNHCYATFMTDPAGLELLHRIGAGPGDVVEPTIRTRKARSATPAAPSRRCSTPPASRTPRRSSARPRSTCSTCAEPTKEPAMKSPICEMLGIEFPLFAFSHCRDVVAAVSRAGGFGVLGATGHTAALGAHRAEVDRRPRRRQALRHRPAVPGEHGHGRRARRHLQLAEDPHPAGAPRVRRRPAGLGRRRAARAGRRLRRPRRSRSIRRQALRTLEAAFEHPIKLIANALGVPPPAMIEMGKRHGVPVAALVGAKEHAIRQVNAGVDILVVQGTEAGGHCGEVTTMVLVPEVLQAIKKIRDVPVLAAGGIMNGAPDGRLHGDGRGRRLDRLGVAGDHWRARPREIFREKMIEASSRDAVRVKTRTGKPARQLRSAWTEAWERSPEQPRRAADAADEPGLRERPALGATAPPRAAIPRRATWSPTSSARASA